jgi:putative ABC transport system permease protein
MVLRQGMTLCMIGLATGLVAAVALTRVLASLLYEVGSADPVTYTSVSLLLTTVGLVAIYVPDRRATRIDPMLALRHE